MQNKNILGNSGCDLGHPNKAFYDGLKNASPGNIYLLDQTFRF